MAIVAVMNRLAVIAVIAVMAIIAINCIGYNGHDSLNGYISCNGIHFTIVLTIIG